MSTSDGAASSSSSSSAGQSSHEFSENEKSWTDLVLTKEKIAALRRAYEDFESPDGLSFEELLEALSLRTTVALELPGAGIAIATDIAPRVSADVAFYMFDRQLKGRAPLFLEFVEMLFDVFKLRRVTMAFPSFAPMERVAERMGMVKEGVLRDAGPRGEGISIYGILEREIWAGRERRRASDAGEAGSSVPQGG